MRIQTTRKEGEAVQYTGGNIEEICEDFNLGYRVLRSYTSFRGKDCFDIRLGDTFQEEDLLAGDYVFRDAKTGEWSVIPIYEFEEYWEQT